MQTRKRAKSVSFGKKEKISKEHEPVKEIAEEKVVAVQPEEPKEAEKVESKETVSPVDTALPDDLSATLPKTEETPEIKPIEAATATPVNEFVTDTPLSSTPEVPKSTSSEAETPSGEKESSITQPIELTQPTVTPVQSEDLTQPALTPELSATPPQSAFTIQENGAPATPPIGMSGMSPRTDKKRFGLYFFIIAFLSFALGLGAIAAANYFHIITLSMPKVASNIAIPGIKSTPTTIPTTPPTVAPTEQPVDLSAYTISVLNGSTIAGKAATVKASLTSAGYKVTTTGNADKSDYTKTAIAAKATVAKAYLSKLQSELGKTFDVDTTIGTLSSSSTTDVTVTLGSKTTQ